MTNDTTQSEMTEDMRFCLKFLEFLAEGSENPDVIRAFRGAQYMSLALDGLSGMLRALPEETQQRMAQDMYAMAVDQVGGNVH